MTYTDSNVVLPAFYALKATFLAELEQEKVPNNALVFIGDAKQIYTHGIYFDLGTDKENTISAALLALNTRVDTTNTNIETNEEIIASALNDLNDRIAAATEIQVGGETPTDSNIKIYIDESEDTTAEIYTKSQSDEKFVVVTTLNSAPTSSTTTYQDNGSTKNYKIGDKIIVPSTGKVYTLVQLSGGTATWNLGGSENVQANWSQTDSTAADYIKNKPTNLVHSGTASGSANQADFNANSDTVHNKAQVLSSTLLGQARKNINAANIDEAVICIESNSAPTTSTLSYTDSFGTLRNYKVGDQFKVYDSSEGKYKIYILFNINNGTATWINIGVVDSNGVMIAPRNTSYTTAQVRNIVFSTSEPTSSDGSNGDIWIVYET